MDNSFGNMLKYLREREGKSQETVAIDLEISRSALANYEQGRRFPSHELEETIADYFNVDLNTLRGIETPSLDNDTVEIVKTYKELSEKDKQMVKRLMAYMRAFNRSKSNKPISDLNDIEIDEDQEIIFKPFKDLSEEG